MTHIRLKSGNYSDIKLISLLKNDVYVEKIYGKKTIIGGKSISVLFDFFLEYKKKALLIDAPLCDSSYDRVIHGSKNSYIVEFQSYIAINFEDYVRTELDRGKLIFYVEKYIRVFKKVWQSQFPIGIDPKIRNFGIDSDGELKFFDFFPPHQKIEKDTFFIWPEPSVVDKSFFVERYFSHLQSRVIYVQLMRHIIHHKLVSPSELRDMIRILLGEAAYSDLFISEHTRKRVLSSPTPHDMDILRMIGCELCFEKKITLNQLALIFINTHISSYNILTSQQKLTIIVNILNKAIKNNE